MRITIKEIETSQSKTNSENGLTLLVISREKNKFHRENIFKLQNGIGTWKVFFISD